MVVKALTWPVIALLIIGGTHLAAEAIWPDLQTLFIPPVVGLVLFAAGLWAGVNASRSGGNFITVVVVGAILGVLPLALDTLGFGALLDRGMDVGRLNGIFGFLMVFWGAVIGGGFDLGRQPSA